MFNRDLKIRDYTSSNRINYSKALMNIAKIGDRKFLAFFLELNNMNFDTKILENYEGESLFHIFAKNNDFDSIQYFIEKFPEIFSKVLNKEVAIINSGNKPTKESIIDIAVKNGNINLVGFLLDKINSLLGVKIEPDLIKSYCEQAVSNRKNIDPSNINIFVGAPIANDYYGNKKLIPSNYSKALMNSAKIGDRGLLKFFFCLDNGNFDTKILENYEGESLFNIFAKNNDVINIHLFVEKFPEIFSKVLNEEVALINSDNKPTKGSIIDIIVKNEDIHLIRFINNKMVNENLIDYFIKKKFNPDITKEIINKYCEITKLKLNQTFIDILLGLDKKFDDTRKIKPDYNIFNFVNGNVKDDDEKLDCFRFLFMLDSFSLKIKEINDIFLEMYYNFDSKQKNFLEKKLIKDIFFNINRQDNKGNTILHYANLVPTNVNFIEFLKSEGAKNDIENNEGVVPSSYFSHLNNKGIPSLPFLNNEGIPSFPLLNNECIPNSFFPLLNNESIPNSFFPLLNNESIPNSFFPPLNNESIPSSFFHPLNNESIHSLYFPHLKNNKNTRKTGDFHIQKNTNIKSDGNNSEENEIKEALETIIKKYKEVLLLNNSTSMYFLIKNLLLKKYSKEFKNENDPIYLLLKILGNMIKNNNQTNSYIDYTSLMSDEWRSNIEESLLKMNKRDFNIFKAMFFADETKEKMKEITNNFYEISNIDNFLLDITNNVESLRKQITNLFISEFEEESKIFEKTIIDQGYYVIKEYKFLNEAYIYYENIITNLMLNKYEEYKESLFALVRYIVENSDRSKYFKLLKALNDCFGENLKNINHDDEKRMKLLTALVDSAYEILDKDAFSNLLGFLKSNNCQLIVKINDDNLRKLIPLSTDGNIDEKKLEQIKNAAKTILPEYKFNRLNERIEEELVQILSENLNDICYFAVELINLITDEKGDGKIKRIIELTNTVLDKTEFEELKSILEAISDQKTNEPISKK